MGVMHVGTTVKARFAVPVTSGDSVVREVTIEIPRLNKQAWDEAFAKIAELRDAQSGKETPQ